MSLSKIARQPDQHGGLSEKETRALSDAIFDSILDDVLTEKLVDAKVREELGDDYGDEEEYDEDEEDEEDEEDKGEEDDDTEQQDERIKTYLGETFQKSIKQIFADGVKNNDPIVRLLQQGYNKIPDPETSHASKELMEEIADLLQCRIPDVKEEELEPWERTIARIIQGHLDLGIQGVSPQIRPSIERSSTRQWARQIGKLLTHKTWRDVFLPNQEIFPDIDQHLKDTKLPEERGCYLFKIPPRDIQHTHSYSGSGFSSTGIRERQLAREKVREGKQKPGQFVENLIAQKDKKGRQLREKPRWAQTVRVPPEELVGYKDLLYFLLVVRIAEAVFISQLGQYDSRIRKFQAFNKLSSIREVRNGTAPWLGANQSNPLCERLGIPWPDSIKKELRAAYRKQWLQDNKDHVTACKKQYYQDHKEDISTHKKQYYQDHKEGISAHKKQYYQDHKEDILACNRQLKQALSWTFPCPCTPSCGRYFFTNNSAKQHKKHGTCPGPRPFKCPNGCHRTSGFLSQEAANEHSKVSCHKSPQGRIKIPCPRGCGREFCNVTIAARHADSPACVKFDGVPLRPRQECPACGNSFLITATTKLLQHANSTACPQNPEGLTRYVRDGAGKVIPIRDTTSPPAGGENTDAVEALRSLGMGATALVEYDIQLRKGTAKALAGEIIQARKARSWLEETPWSGRVKEQVRQELSHVPTKGTYGVVKGLEEAAGSLAARGRRDGDAEQYLVLLVSLRALSRHRRVSKESCGAMSTSWAAELVDDVNVDTREQVTGCARRFLRDL